MMSPLQDPGSLRSHVRNLRYAIATTTCDATADVLQRMLNEAETRLQKQNIARPNLSSSKQL